MPQEDHTDENKVRGCVSQVIFMPGTHQRQVVKGPTLVAVEETAAESAVLFVSI